jgi:hypothetical protein
MGEVFVTQQNKHYLYGLPHSSLANLYFHFINDPIWEEKSISANNPKKFWLLTRICGWKKV